MFPGKLSLDDEIRVIAPSASFANIDASTRDTAAENLSALGLQLSYGENCQEIDEFRSSSIASRIADIHEFTFPIGGKGKLVAYRGKVDFTIIEH